MGEDGDSEVCWCEALGPAGLKKLRGDRFQTGFQATKGRNTSLRRARRLEDHAGAGFVERAYLLATAGGCHRRWNGRQLQVT